ncbi:TetR/AcrR family transcriptional regulator [Mycolicibacillus parakoreensis]|uniref:TetR/AcrR family transcriptional regulator n=1 Tax=Mycolicibacillus parakoreensis TaxID=1069221 RepID=A0ABY3U1C4_9MYCO|nr:TetR/AcrR family transcriptional regulator [Mycolicibacillus parakoreensis]MCV7314764.1 TetR/AcrR family transcriptional regulator [Mycolicibacillus parakoreensis]ULN53768.1 TetR/AcrR family transcriptional regulator [Mycolicibacillus parakoreensis]
MRTRGWGGNVPASDDEAVARILEATRRTIDEHGEQTRIADVARKLGVTRQTVYRYFPSTDELLSATAADGASGFLDQLAEALTGITDPGEAVVEGIAITLERLPGDPYVGLLLRSQRSSAFAQTVTTDTARLFGRSILDRIDVDWTVFSAQAIDDIIEMILRTLQSFILAPLPASGDELRRLLRCWIAPAVTAASGATTAPGPARR